MKLTHGPERLCRIFAVQRYWRSLGDSNPCFRRERATSWAARRRERAVPSSSLDPAAWQAPVRVGRPYDPDGLRREPLGHPFERLDCRQCGPSSCFSVAYRLHSSSMIEVQQTEEFSSWLRRLRDANAVARIVAPIRRMEQGNPGDARSVGSGVMELRIDYGPGYRLVLHAAWGSCRDPVARRPEGHANSRYQAGTCYGP